MFPSFMRRSIQTLLGRSAGMYLQYHFGWKQMHDPNRVKNVTRLNFPMELIHSSHTINKRLINFRRFISIFTQTTLFIFSWIWFYSHKILTHSEKLNSVWEIKSMIFGRRPPPKWSSGLCGCAQHPRTCNISLSLLVGLS